MRMGTQELIIIFLIVFLLFGATRLPQLGSSLGSAIRNFKKGFAGEEQPPAPPQQQATQDPKNLGSGAQNGPIAQDSKANQNQG